MKLPAKSLTVAKFCEIEDIRPTKYVDLRRRGLAPEEIPLPGGHVRITAEAHMAWRARMMRWGKSAEAKRQAARRHAVAVKAGAASVKSPKHISKRRLAASMAALAANVKKTGGRR